MTDLELAQVALPEPVAHMWQHGETGMTGFVEHAPPQELLHWERVNGPRFLMCDMMSFEQGITMFLAGMAKAREIDAPAPKYDPWVVLGRFFKFWVGSALYDGDGVEVDLEEPYEAFRAIHAQQSAALGPNYDDAPQEHKDKP